MVMTQNNLENALNGLSFDEAKKLLQKEGRKLERIAKSEWRKYLNSYSPKEYIRTGRSEKAIKLNNVKQVSSDELGIELTWQNDLVYHDSVLYKKGYTSKNKKGHSVMLISRGWHSVKLEKKLKRRIYRFTYYQGSGYIDNVIKRYKAVKDKNVSLELQWSGAFTR